MREARIPGLMVAGLSVKSYAPRRFSNLANLDVTEYTRFVYIRHADGGA